MTERMSNSEEFKKVPSEEARKMAAIKKGLPKDTSWEEINKTK